MGINRNFEQDVATAVLGIMGRPGGPQTEDGHSQISGIPLNSGGGGFGLIVTDLSSLATEVVFAQPGYALHYVGSLSAAGGIVIVNGNLPLCPGQSIQGQAYAEAWKLQLSPNSPKVVGAAVFVIEQQLPVHFIQPATLATAPMELLWSRTFTAPADLALGLWYGNADGTWTTTPKLTSLIDTREFQDVFLTYFTSGSSGGVASVINPLIIGFDSQGNQLMNTVAAADNLSTAVQGEIQSGLGTPVSGKSNFFITPVTLPGLQSLGTTAPTGITGKFRMEFWGKR